MPKVLAPRAKPACFPLIFEEPADAPCPPNVITAAAGSGRASTHETAKRGKLTSQLETSARNRYAQRPLWAFGGECLIHRSQRNRGLGRGGRDVRRLRR